MIDVLFPLALVAPEIGAELGSIANTAFKKWAGDVAREMVSQAVDEAVGQTRASLPSFLQGAVDTVSGNLKPRIKNMATETAQTILGQRMAGCALVPLALYDAQLAVIEAARAGEHLQERLAEHDAVRAKTTPAG